MKIIITGASGFLGKYLVSYLTRNNVELLLVGRDKDVMRNIFPCANICNYKEIEKYGSGTDIIIHLAVANNDKKLTKKEFYDANVYLFNKILKFASKISVKKVINISTFNVFSNKIDNYTLSKKEAISLFDKFDNFNKINIFCPAIYSQNFKGKLSILNYFPKAIRFFLFSILSAFKPVVSITKVVETIFKIVSDKRESSFSLYIADDKDTNLIYKAFRKILDYSFVFLVLGLFGWLLFIVWILVKFSSKGPGIFSQKRIGQHEKLFTLYKFRTMSLGTKNISTHQISPNSITKFGRVLRMTKIDELPQILNIFFNELSLIGPRPGLPSQIDLYKARKSSNTFSIKPGITGYAQINNVDMSNPHILADWDSKYIAMRSILFDLKIFLKTVLGRGQGDNVNKL